MPEVHHDQYSNPSAPAEHDQASVDKREKLSNEDFRQLIMTPQPAKPKPSTSALSAPPKKPVKKVLSQEEEEKRKQKANYYAKAKKEEEERQAEWAKKYRDRATERRDGDNPDYAGTADVASATSGYRSVAPNLDPKVVDAHRKKSIQESKFLGGDMQHTHMVKGLDYVLLNKVRSEMHVKEQEEVELSLLEKKREKERARAEFTKDLQFKTTLGKNIFRTVFLTKPQERNELFSPGRMAYVYDLEDEYAESDIPTTLLRSIADCPTIESTTLSTNDIVINKLTQILSYLRQGMHSGKKGKRKGDRISSIVKPVVKELSKKPTESKSTSSIFPDADEYVFDPKSKAASATSYFDNTPAKEIRETPADIEKSAAEFVEAVKNKYKDVSLTSEGQLKTAARWDNPSSSQPQQQPTKGKGRSKQEKPAKDGRTGFGGFDSHYAECYPGGQEEYDATYDSDEDTDFTKMDMGNKKGPVKRWDFENEDDYSSYQSKREALPKAAFQYGVKMNDGRKTRRFGGGMNEKAKEKAKLNREWQQISAILDKRKPGHKGGESAAKRQKID